MLVRRFVNATFRLLMRAEWDKKACEEYNDIMSCEGGPLWCALPLIRRVFNADMCDTVLLT